MAGTLFGLPLSQQLDLNGEPMVGALLYIYEGGTTTPADAYSDTGLSNLLPFPLETDSNGRLPMFWLDDGTYRARLTDADGVLQFDTDSILAIGPSSGGGGGGSTVDANSLLQTGDLKSRYGTGAHSGFVRANGRTIGSATSGATERANADTQALFEYLYAADTNLSVSGGRGASASADWGANKTIALPDWRGCALVGMDDMGNTAAGRLTTATFSTSGQGPTVLGALAGAERHTLTTAELPSHTHAGTTASNGAHSHTYSYRSSLSSVSSGGFGGHWLNDGSSTTSTDGAHTHTFTSDPTGGGTAHNTLQPSRLATIYIKL